MVADPNPKALKEEMPRGKGEVGGGWQWKMVVLRQMMTRRGEAGQGWRGAAQNKP